MDPDNDYIKCRMAQSFFECGGICNGLRNAILDGVSTLCQRYTISAPISGRHKINVFPSQVFSSLLFNDIPHGIPNEQWKTLCNNGSRGVFRSQPNIHDSDFSPCFFSLAKKHLFVTTSYLLPLSYLNTCLSYPYDINFLIEPYLEPTQKSTVKLACENS